MRSEVGRERVAGFAALVVTMSVLVGSVALAGAQTETSAPGSGATSDTAGGVTVPAPDAFVAPLTAAISSPDQPPELKVANLTVSKADAQTVTFQVGFDEPFGLPTKDYRVSVYVGDPNVEQTRVSYLAGEPEGRVEKGDGTSWQTVGASPASITVFGTAEITVPVTGIPPGSAVWVEAESGTGLGLRSTLSPYFAYDSLVGKSADGKLGSSTWGYIGSAFGRVPGAVPMPDRGVVLALVNQGLSLTYLDPVPGKVIATTTGAVLDYIKISPGRTQTGPRADFIAVDRTTGTIKLFDASVSPAVDVSDKSNWLIQGLPAGSPGAPATLTFDMEAVAQALGFTLTDDGVALGVDRAFSLTDGRVLTGVGVIGTVGWFNEATATTPPDSSIAVPPSDEGTAEPATTSSNRTQLIVGLAAAVGVLVILALALGLRRRRRRRETEATGEFEWNPTPSRTAEPVVAAAATTTLEPEPSAAPEPVAEPEPPPEVAPEAEPEPVVGSEPVEADEPVEAATDSGYTPKRRSPDEALAALEADLQAMTERLDRLGDD